MIPEEIQADKKQGSKTIKERETLAGARADGDADAAAARGARRLRRAP